MITAPIKFQKSQTNKHASSWVQLKFKRKRKRLCAFSLEMRKNRPQWERIHQLYSIGIFCELHYHFHQTAHRNVLLFFSAFLCRFQCKVHHFPAEWIQSEACRIAREYYHFNLQLVNMYILYGSVMGLAGARAFNYLVA